MAILKQRYFGRQKMYKPDLLHWHLVLENIGPHQKTMLSGDFNKLHIGVCAHNGLGKTFISKAFSTLQKDNTIINQSTLIKEGKRMGRFLTQITQDGETIEGIEVLFGSRQLGSVHTHYLYHIYNQDYVKQNLELVGYQPDGKIEGMVLGKEQIDLSKEKQNLANIKEQGIRLRKEIEREFENRKRRLRIENRVNPSTTEYKKFSFEEVEKKQLYYYPLAKSYEELAEEYRKLENLPDEIPDLQSIKFPIEESFLETIQELLETRYKKGYFSDEFKQEIQQRSAFIEEGLSYITSEVTDIRDDINDSKDKVCTIKEDLNHVQNKECPFCHQILAQKAREWIQCYYAYFQNEEAKRIKQLNECQRQLLNLKETLKVFLNNQYVACKQQYNMLACYLNGTELLEDLTLDPIIFRAIEDINQCLEEKKLDISVISFRHKKSIYLIKESLYTLSKQLDRINKKIQILNMQKNNNTAQKLKVRKQICQAAFNELMAGLKPQIEQLYELKEKYKRLDSEIKEKEYTNRTSKRSLVATAFKQLLSLFFREKYTFDEVTFSLCYSDRVLNNKAYKVLSEGEKEVIAFCYYLASSHMLVESEADYGRLFLVIDDPVAHMDERYGRMIAKILTHLTELYYSEVEIAYIVLSHDTHFMNYLRENGCFEKVYYLQESKATLGNVEVAATME